MWSRMVTMKALILLVVLTTATAYNILCIFPVPSRSHNILGKGVVDALLSAGHEVTWVTPFPEIVDKDLPKTLKIIDVSATRNYATVDMTQKKNANFGLAFVKAFGANITKEVMATPAVREAVIKGRYDAVFTEEFFSDIQAGFAAVLQVPWMLLSGIPLTPKLEGMVDDVRSVGTVPLMFNDCSIPMGFMDRLFNSFLFLAMTVSSWLDNASTDDLYKALYGPLAKARGSELPPFSDAYYNVSILFVNSHEAIASVFSTPPNVVNIAGYHIVERVPPLPKDLQDLLDRSPQGVVYFSMGSVVKSSSFPERTRLELLKQFGALKQTVLWKFEDKIEGLPSNVHVRSWMPQPSILAHPNVRVFITHGGLLSTLEAISAGVPLLAVPVFGDQPANAIRATRAGYARTVMFSEDMAEELGTQLREMLKDNSYSQKAKYLSKLFSSRPLPPAKLIPYYVELAIETRGAYHLRSLSHQYSWYQRWMLDQAACLLLAVAIAYKLLRIVLSKIFGSSSSQKRVVKEKKKKN